MSEKFGLDWGEQDCERMQTFMLIIQEQSLLQEKAQSGNTKSSQQQFRPMH